MFDKKIMFENRLLTFKEFFLSESIKPKFVEYGTDLVNKKWLQLPDNFFITFFEANEEFYAVIYRNGYIGFATNYTDKRDKILSDINNIRSYNEFILKFHYNRKPIPNAMRVFNNVFYVMTEAIKKFEPNEVLFDGEDELLTVFYKKMVENKYFKSAIEDLGFSYVGRQDKLGRNFFTFEKN